MAREGQGYPRWRRDMMMMMMSKEKTNTGWKFLNNYINKRKKQGDKAKNQLYKFVAYNIKWKSESRCVCEARVQVWSRML